MFVIRYPFRPSLIEDYMNACNVGNDCYEDEHEYSSSIRSFRSPLAIEPITQISNKISLSANHEHSIPIGSPSLFKTEIKI